METCTRDDAAAIIEAIEKAFERSADRLMARLEACYGALSPLHHPVDQNATESEAQASERELLGGNR